MQRTFVSDSCSMSCELWPVNVIWEDFLLCSFRRRLWQIARRIVHENLVNHICSNHLGRYWYRSVSFCLSHCWIAPWIDPDTIANGLQVNMAMEIDGGHTLLALIDGYRAQAHLRRRTSQPVAHSSRLSDRKSIVHMFNWVRPERAAQRFRFLEIPWCENEEKVENCALK